MEHLVKELNVLLKLLEHEHVSSATAEKMSVVRNLLGQLKPSGKHADITDLCCLVGCQFKRWSHILFYKAYVDRVTGSDFIYMNTSLYGNGTSFVESLFEEFGKFVNLR